MTSELSSISTSDSDFADTTDNDINLLITKKKRKNKKYKKQKKKSLRYSSRYRAPPFQPYYAPYNYGPNPQHQQIEEMYETLLQQIEYNKKRRMKRKKKKYLLCQQNMAAQKIQKWWRKYRVVSAWKDPLLNKEVGQLLLNNDIANKYISSLIEEYFLTEFVPDLLIEILEDKDNEFCQKDVLTQIIWAFYQEIEEEICLELCILICNETIHEIVSSYFVGNKNGLQLKSIIHQINCETINFVVAEQCSIVVDESIEELIIQYLIECKSIELYNDLLPDLIQTNVNITLIEYILSNYIDYLLDQVLSEWIHDIANQEYNKQSQRISKEKKEKEYDLIESCLRKYLFDAQMLNIFIHKLSTRSQTSFINNSAINLVIHEEMSKILIQKHLNLYQMHARTKQNTILNQTLIKLLSETSIHHFINFLKHQNS